MPRIFIGKEVGRGVKPATESALRQSMSPCFYWPVLLGDLPAGNFWPKRTTYRGILPSLPKVLKQNPDHFGGAGRVRARAQSAASPRYCQVGQRPLWA